MTVNNLVGTAVALMMLSLAGLICVVAVKVWRYRP